MEPRTKDEQNSGPGQTKDVREANENIRKGQGDDSTEPPTPRKGNKPALDRDR